MNINKINKIIIALLIISIILATVSIITLFARIGESSDSYSSASDSYSKNTNTNSSDNTKTNTGGNTNTGGDSGTGTNTTNKQPTRNAFLTYLNNYHNFKNNNYTFHMDGHNQDGCDYDLNLEYRAYGFSSPKGLYDFRVTTTITSRVQDSFDTLTAYLYFTIEEIETIAFYATASYGYNDITVQFTNITYYSSSNISYGNYEFSYNYLVNTYSSEVLERGWKALRISYYLADALFAEAFGKHMYE